MTEAEVLVSLKTEADDIIDLDDESVWTNYAKLLCRVMQESSETWKVKKYLEDCKASIFSNSTRARFSKERHQAEDNLTITSIKYKSKHQNDLEARDAKQSLSSHSYKRFADSLQHTRRLQHWETESGDFVIWPEKVSEEDANKTNLHHYSLIQRCSYKKRKQQLIQCAHKLPQQGVRFQTRRLGPLMVQ
jgi:hypothetical protein